MDHENIVKTKGLFYDSMKSRLYLVLEKALGENLYDEILVRGAYPECDAKIIIRQLLGAVSYMHAHKICHRDIKPENIIVNDLSLKIVDFNVSKNFESILKMNTHTGTLAFSAPELLCGEQYSENIDEWSVGCVMYTILCGNQPFDDIPYFF